jgi:hypothetical protein
MPLPQLLYAQVVKSYRCRRIIDVKHRVVFGTMDRVKEVLAACCWQINTAFVERLNLDIRQRVAAGGSTRCARARMACSINSYCFRATITLSCLMPAYASPY